ncbi:MAG TPA: ribonuclease HII [bacterium]|nr:ribonuclease HII [bacterium]
MSPSFELEDAVRKRAGNNDLFVAGLDEVGVGALAGPVIAAAVALRINYASWLANVDDSKKLPERIREKMYDVIQQNALAWGIGYQFNKVIDSRGIAWARENTITTAFLSCKKALRVENVAAVVDDRRLSSLRDELGGKASIFSNKADEKSYSVAAASIVAKVIRDRFMRDAALKFPQYGFEKHKGYATKYHIEMLRKYGPCPIHRLSFRPVREAQVKLPTKD